jgi:hypothetical protein
MPSKWYTRSVVILAVSGIVTATIGIVSARAGFASIFALNSLVIMREFLR